MAQRVVGLLAALLIVPAAGLAQTSGADTFDSGGVRISYADRGRGDPVVLIHGFTGAYARH